MNEPTTTTTTIWHPNFLNPIPTHRDHHHRFLLILNQPFTLPLLNRLWASSHWRACADGGSNRLYDSFSLDGDRELYIPDMIKGDLDSARKDVLGYYRALGVKIIQDRDQNSTDLMKCLNEIYSISPPPSPSPNPIHNNNNTPETKEIIILGGLSGRLDHTIHTLSHLHKLRNLGPGTRIYVVTDENVAWVLSEGDHTIQINHQIYGPTCGLLPVGIDMSVISTRGLKWNLDNTESSFEGLISTSNHLLPEVGEVWIRTSKPIWWSMEIRPLS